MTSGYLILHPIDINTNLKAMKKNLKYVDSSQDNWNNQAVLKSGQRKKGTFLYKIASVVVFLCSIFTLHSQAQEIRIFNTENSGLPNNEVTSIAIDAQGNKWFGTYDGQVAKFDGVNWSVYNNTNSILPANYPITSIAIDKQNNKWIGTYLIYGTPSNEIEIGPDGGLIKFDDSNWTIYNKTNSGLPNNSISAISVDNTGNKWIATRNGLAKFDDANWTVFNNANSELPDNNITAITIDESGSKWIGTSNGAVAKFDDENMTVIKYFPKINEINSIAIDNQGNKWFGGTSDWPNGLNGGGLAFFDDKDWSVYNRTNSELPYNSVTAIAIDKQGNKWIGTYLPELFFYGGIVKFDGINWVFYSETNSVLPEDYIYSIVIDDYGNIWFGTWFSGVIVYNENAITTGLKDNITAQTNDFTLYPNPAKDFITIDGLQFGTLEIFNSTGAVLRNFEFDGAPSKIDISNLPEGMYSIRVTTDDKVFAKKFIKSY